jgi:carbon monoxide dehydrogenase subunit G
MATTQITESHAFSAPPARAYEALVDPVAIKNVLPGCDTFDEVGPEQYKVTLAVNLIAFSATVSGDVTITDRVPAESYRVLVTGQGSLGAVNIECRMRLSPVGSGSRLDYEIDVEALGQLGIVAAPVLGPAAKMIVGQFMDNMAKEIDAREEAVGGRP